MIKRIETREDKEKREQRNKTILGVILGLVMLFGSVGYAFLSTGGDNSSGGGKVKQNGLEFIRQGEYWQTAIQGHNFYFYYLPNETSSPGISKTLGDYANKPLYFANNGEAEAEISRNLMDFLPRTPQKACLNDENCTENIPVKNCSDNIIVIEEQQWAGITFEENNCVHISSNNTLKEADAFLYKILGIK